MKDLAQFYNPLLPSAQSKIFAPPSCYSIKNCACYLTLPKRPFRLSSNFQNRFLLMCRCLGYKQNRSLLLYVTRWCFDFYICVELRMVLQPYALYINYWLRHYTCSGFCKTSYHLLISSTPYQSPQFPPHLSLALLPLLPLPVKDPHCRIRE